MKYTFLHLASYLLASLLVSTSIARAEGREAGVVYSIPYDAYETVRICAETSEQANKMRRFMELVYPDRKIRFLEISEHFKGNVSIFYILNENNTAKDLFSQCPFLDDSQIGYVNKTAKEYYSKVKRNNIIHMESVYKRSTGKELDFFPFINYCEAINDLRLYKKLKIKSENTSNKIKNAILYFVDSYKCFSSYGRLFRMSGSSQAERNIIENRTLELEKVNQ